MADPTPLEQSIAASHAEGTDLRPTLGAFMNGTVVVPSAVGLTGLSGGFQPLIISNGETGFMCVFSSMEKVAAMLGPATNHLFAEMKGVDVVRGLTDGFGIAVNPGSDQGVEFKPSIVTALKATLK